MEINQKKTNVLLFNFSKTIDFPPELSVGDSDILSVVSSAKLLGVIINDQLNWEDNTQYITKKASTKMWMLRKLRNLNLDSELLVDFYVKEIRSIVEFSCGVWAGGLTQAQSRTIEHIQRVAVSIIMSGSPTKSSYSTNCAALGLETLTSRRDTITLRFARTTARKSWHMDLFTLNPSQHSTRHQTLYRQYNCRTSRFRKSPLVHLTDLLNNQS